MEGAAWFEEGTVAAFRGFATMDENRRREIASKGGKAAHAKGTAHEWSSEQARRAGRKGGLARASRSTRANGITITKNNHR
jgi:general stress protein YciG